jgi:hypothetical protein
MRLAVLAASAGMAMLGAVPASAAGADKLYVLDCGHISAADQSRWSPGVNVGVPIEPSDNCYLIHDPQGWFLWDTGLPDALAATPEGTTSANGALHVKRPKTLAGQLDELGVKPADIKAMAISHTHPDHIGNVELFPQVMLYVQKAEYEWPGADGAPRFNPNHPVTLLEGDRDVFGDVSVVIISTPATRLVISRCWSGCRRPAPSCSRATPSTSRPTGTIAACRRSTPTRTRPWPRCSASPISLRRRTASSGSTTTSRRPTRRRSRRSSTTKDIRRNK